MSSFLCVFHREDSMLRLQLTGQKKVQALGIYWKAKANSGAESKQRIFPHAMLAVSLSMHSVAKTLLSCSNRVQR